MSSNTPSDPDPTYQPPATSPSAPPPAAPAYGSPSGYAAAPAPAYEPAEPQPKGPSTLGIIALAAAVVGVIVGAILVFIGGQQIGSLAQYGAMAPDGTYQIDEGSLNAAGQQAASVGGLLSFAGFAVYGLLGLWGFIQGIVAIVKKRGRGWGIAAIVVAVIGGGVLFALWTAGVAAGVAPYIA